MHYAAAARLRLLPTDEEYRRQKSRRYVRIAARRLQRGSATEGVRG